MAYLIKSVEMYRCDSEEEVKEFIEDLKHNPYFELVKYASTKKEVHNKKEDDEWYRLEVTKLYNDEKAPISSVKIQYKGEEVNDWN